MKKATIDKKISFIRQFKKSEILRKIEKMIDDHGLETVIGYHGIEELAEKLMNDIFSRHRLNIENRKIRSSFDEYKG